MARSIDSGFQTEIEAKQLRPLLLVKAEFDSGDVLLWSGIGTIVYDGQTYQGAGQLLTISEIKETQNIEAPNLTFTLSGIPPALVSVALLEDYQGRPVHLYFGVVDNLSSLHVYEIYGGAMDIMEIRDNGQSASISISSEGDLVRLKRANGRQYTPEDQKINYPDDKGFDFVPTIQDIQIVWGR